MFSTQKLLTSWKMVPTSSALSCFFNVLLQPPPFKPSFPKLKLQEDHIPSRPMCHPSPHQKNNYMDPQSRFKYRNNWRRIKEAIANKTHDPQTQLPNQFEDQWTKDTAAVHIKSGAQHQNTTASNRSGSFLVYPKTLKVNKDIQRYWEITLLWKSCPFHPNGPLETKFYFPAKISNKKHTPTDKSLLLNIHLVLQIVKSWSLRAVYHSLLAKISWQVKNSYLPYNFPHSIWQIFKADFSMTQIFKSNLKLQMFGTIWEILATEIYGTMWDSSTAHSMAVKW